MLRRQEWQVILIFLLTVLGVPDALAAKPSPKVLSPMNELMSSPEEHAKAEVLALEGSAEAAYLLAKQYELTMQYSEAIFWGGIAAENGSIFGAYNLAYRLAESPDSKQRLRARYWLKKVIASGNKELAERARKILVDIEEKDHAGKEFPVVFPERYPKW